MKRQERTRPCLAKALKTLRTSKELTRQQVAERATRFRGQGSLLESQIADFERGKAAPSVETLVSLLAACSDDGETVDFGLLQQACAGPPEGAPEPPSTLAPDAGSEWLVKLVEAGFAVQGTTGTSAVFSDLHRACLAAAILPQAGRGLPYRLVRRDDAGFDVTVGSTRTVGWIREYSPETIEALHVIEGIVSSPAALAWLLEAVHRKPSPVGSLA